MHCTPEFGTCTVSRKVEECALNTREYNFYKLCLILVKLAESKGHLEKEMVV